MANLIILVAGHVREGRVEITDDITDRSYPTLIHIGNPTIQCLSPSTRGQRTCHILLGRPEAAIVWPLPETADALERDDPNRRIAAE